MESQSGNAQPRDTQPDFSLEVSQNPYLSAGETQMHAVLTIIGSATGGPVAEAAEVIMVDCSSSMDWPPTKIAAARRATAAAIDTLRDGVFFAIVEGTSRARVVYPPAPRLAAATPQAKVEAKAAVARLIASGGTAIGTWLTQACELLDEHPTAIRHALLLTDGKNQTESREQLERVLDACAGRFVCDARGIGEDWEPRELLRIVSVLRGAADAVLEDSDLEADFRKMMQMAMRKVVPDLRIRIKLVPGNRLWFLKQVFPTELDLTEHGVEIDGHTEFSTGSWAEENREYHVCIEVPPDSPVMSEDVQVAQVKLAAISAGGTDTDAPRRPMPILVHRTADPVLSTRLNSKVGHYLDQEELGQAMMAGCDAYDAGDLEVARAQWGHAVEMASASGNEECLTRLRRLVDIDPVDNVVRIKENLQRRDIHSAVMGSSIYSRSPDSDSTGQPGGKRPAGPDRTCPKCRRISRADAIICIQCGQRIGEYNELAGEQTT